MRLADNVNAVPNFKGVVPGHRRNATQGHAQFTRHSRWWRRWSQRQPCCCCCCRNAQRQRDSSNRRLLTLLEPLTEILHHFVVATICAAWERRQVQTSPMPQGCCSYRCRYHCLSPRHRGVSRERPDSDCEFGLLPQSDQRPTDSVRLAALLSLASVNADTFGKS